MAFSTEMFLIKGWLLKKVFPRHLKNLEEIKKYSPQTVKQLVEDIEKSVDLSGWGLVHIVYAAPQSWGWEIIFKFVYPLMIKGSYLPYYDLLVGFTNQTIQADQLLWEAANQKDSKTKRVLVENYLEKYGSRVDDADISKPTLREQPEVVEQMMIMYENTKSPLERLKEAEKRRYLATKEALNRLTIPKSLFLHFLKWVQSNTHLREERRFYEFVMDYYVRRMILRLAELLKMDKQAIFSKTWGEIKHAAYY